jgi:hypothetical protein
MSSIHDLINSVVKSNESTIMGKVASEFYEINDVAGGYCWGCDVDVGQAITYTDQYNREQTTTVIRNVPIATNNRDIFYATVGWPVLLRKMTSSRYAIVGLGKSIHDVTNITYVSFTNGLRITRRTAVGYYYRPLTLGELGTIEPFGTLPLGTIGVFNLSDNSFVRARA